jgi:hypothetical protein
MNIDYLTGLFDLNGNIWYKKASDIFSFDSLKLVFENLSVFKFAKFLFTYLIRKSE